MASVKVYGMAFLCGSTLVNVPLLQAGTVVISPKMFKSDVELKQTSKHCLKNLLDASHICTKFHQYLYGDL